MPAAVRIPLLAALILLGSAPARAGSGCGVDPLCPANTLFATTNADPSGEVDLLVIDPTTGAATYDFSFNVGAGLTIFGPVYHDTLDRYVVVTYDPVATQTVGLTFLDRATRSVSFVATTGLPGPAPSLSNNVYVPATDTILAGFSDDGNSVEDQIVELMSDGSAGMVSTVVAEDLDLMTVRRTTGQLFGWDGNAGGGPRLFELTDVFGTLTASAPLPLPNRASLGSLAADPSTSSFFVVDTAADALVRIDGDDTYVDIGPFGYSESVRSVFFGPALRCGDGIVDPGEQCDDGGTAPGDGCDALCMDEPTTCSDAIALSGTLEATAKLKFAKPDRDQVALKGKELALPQGFAPPADLRVDVGGVVIDAPLDAKGKYKSADGRDKVKLKQRKKDGTWKLSAKRKKSDLAAALGDEGLVDEDNPKPGKAVQLHLCLSADGANHERALPLSYRSKAGKSGKAK